MHALTTMHVDPGGCGDEAVQVPQHHDGERAVPGAGGGDQRRRRRGGEGDERGAVQRDGALAWRPAEEDGVVGRAGVRDAVPHQARGELQLPVHRARAGGHAVVARTQLLAPGHRPWRPRHPPPRRRPLPFQPADQGGPHPPRYVRHYMLGRVCVNISSNMDIISLEHSTRVLHLLKLISILLMVGYT
jgi:hypothetical protein